MIEIMDAVVAIQNPDPWRNIIRIRTTAWSDKRGIYLQKSLTYLHKYSSGVNALKMETEFVTPLDALQLITNLDACGYGLYELELCNAHYDWETGYMDSYAIKLVPFTPEQVEQKQ